MGCTATYLGCMGRDGLMTLITTSEAAQILAVSTKQINRMIQKEELTIARKLNGIRGAYLLNLAEVEGKKK